MGEVSLSGGKTYIGCLPPRCPPIAVHAWNKNAPFSNVEAIGFARAYEKLSEILLWTSLEAASHSSSVTFLRTRFIEDTCENMHVHGCHVR